MNRRRAWLDADYVKALKDFRYDKREKVCNPGGSMRLSITRAQWDAMSRSEQVEISLRSGIDCIRTWFARCMSVRLTREGENAIKVLEI